MLYDLFDYLDATGVNEFAEWMRAQQKLQKTKLNARLDWLQQHGENLVPHVLTDTGVRGIRKLRVQGNVQLRPLLCRGPHGDTEYTLLMGAKEVGDAWQPRNAPESANVKKGVVAMNKERRCKHERVN